MAHPRAKLTVHGRRLLVERVLAQGWPPARAADAQGVSVATAYKWLGRWRAEGLAGLTDRSCRPHTSPRRLPRGREQAILAYRAAHRVGPDRIGWALGEAPSTVRAVLRRHQVPRLWELDRPTGQVVALPAPATRRVGPPGRQEAGPDPRWGRPPGPWQSNQQRLDTLPAWLHDDNYHRPHRALDGRSPMQLLNNLPGAHT